MKTKSQKIADVEKGDVLASQAQSIVFVDFTTAPTKEVERLKRSLMAVHGTYKVIKKRLLGIIFKKKDIAVDMSSFDGQVATVFCQNDISDAAGTVYRFLKEIAKEVPAFKMVGGYDVTSKKFFDAAGIETIGKLPSREVLIAQFVGLLSMPTRMLVYTIDQVGKKK